jgi:hypothetical protein
MGSRHGRRVRPIAGAGVCLLGSLLVALLGLAGVASAQGSGQASNIAVSVTLSSKQTALTQVGKGGDVTYGWNQLAGSAATASGTTQVEILGNVDYLGGSGRFFGFVTLKFASLSTLGFLMEGRATKQPDGSTRLKATLKVIDGSAAFTGAKGAGSFSGTRAAALGSPIDITLKARVRTT